MSCLSPTTNIPCKVTNNYFLVLSITFILNLKNKEENIFKIRILNFE